MSIQLSNIEPTKVFKQVNMFVWGKNKSACGHALGRYTFEKTTHFENVTKNVHRAFESNVPPIAA